MKEKLYVFERLDMLPKRSQRIDSCLSKIIRAFIVQNFKADKLFRHLQNKKIICKVKKFQEQNRL